MLSARELGLTVMGTSGKEELVLCPFHDDRTPSAWYNPHKELFYCAVCGFGMSAQQVAEKLGIEIEALDGEEKELDDLDLVIESSPFSLGTVKLYHPYFKSRKIDAYTIAHYGVRWDDTEPQAAVLPITNIRGAVQGVCYRYLNPNEAGTRYRIVGKSAAVWPLHLLTQHEEGKPVIVCEGAWSAMRLYSFAHARGFEITALALLGAKANRKIVETLASFEAIFLYDNDQAGKRACLKMRQFLPLSNTWTVSVSPDDMSDAQIENLFINCGENGANCE